MNDTIFNQKGIKMILKKTYVIAQMVTLLLAINCAAGQQAFAKSETAQKAAVPVTCDGVDIRLSERTHPQLNALERISTAVQLLATDSLDLQAGQEIHLTQGFRAPQGSHFSAQIAACNPSGPPDFPCMGVNTHWSSAMIYTTAFPFTNMFKLSEPFELRNPGLSLDEQGYPTAIPAGQAARTTVFASDYLPAGDYTLHWEGSGVFELDTPNGTFRFDENTSSPQTIPLNAYETGGFIELIIHSVEAGDHLRNLRLYLPGYDDNSSMLTDYYKDFVRPFGVFRTVWWAGVILFEDVVFDEWSERPQVDDFSWGVFDGTFGVPYEVMIDLCNETDTHLWMTIPHTATDDFMAQAAALIEERLRPDLNVWVEFSNEAWNWDYQVDAWLNEEVERLRQDPDIRAFYEEPNGEIDFWDASAYGYHTARLLQIFEDTFENDDRIIGILAGQSGYDVPLRLAVREVERQQRMDLVDAFSVAGYFSFPEGATVDASDLAAVETAMEASIDELFEPDTWDGMDEWAPVLHNMNQFQMAADRGKQMVAYEGGQHLTTYTSYGGSFLTNEQVTTINRHPMLYNLYRRLFDKWAEMGGSTFVHFADVYSYGPEAFSLKEYWNQPISENHKWQALDDYCNNVPVAIEETEACTNCLSAKITLAPNPANTEITIQNARPNTVLTVFDTQGRMVKQQQLTTTNATLQVQGLPNGLYLVRLVEDAQKTVEVRKIVIQH